jgi:hypothetical protein
LKVEKLLKQFRPVSVPCFNFVDDEGNRRKVSAIIVPIGFEKYFGKSAEEIKRILAQAEKEKKV